MTFSNPRYASVKITNPEFMTGCFTQELGVCNGDTISKLQRRLSRASGKLKGTCENKTSENWLMLLFLLVQCVAEWVNYKSLIFHSDSNGIQLWRYIDPEMGPRKLPKFKQPTHDAVKIKDDAIFYIDVEKNEVSVTEDGINHIIGSTLLYLVPCNG